MKTRKWSIGNSNMWFKTVVVILIAFIAGVLHPFYVAELHERSLTFSLLSNFERELTFQSELAFYYSFYKQITQADNLSSTWSSLISDSRTEHCPGDRPNSFQYEIEDERLHCSPLNAIQRFNIYPELALATAYRLLNSWGWLPATCYEVDRAVNASQVLAYTASPDVVARALRTPRNSSDRIPAQLTTTPLQFTNPYVISCVGVGEPVYFYTVVVFLLSLLTPVGLVWSGWLVASELGSNPGSSSSGSWLPVWGALLPAAAFYFHHREATRVQWTPPLRESFAFPFFFLQHAYLLRSLAVDSSVPSHILHCLLLLCFQLPWQFAQFALATQIAALFAAVCLALASLGQHGQQTSELALRLLRRVEGIVLAHLLTHLINYVLQLGNRLLLFSPYLAGLVGTLVGLRMLTRAQFAGQLSTNNGDDGESGEQVSLAYRLLRFLVLPSLLAIASSLTLFAVTSWAMSSFLSKEAVPHDGGHILDLLLHKLSPGGRFHNYHTKLYTCAQEFDFMAWETPLLLTTTGLIPGALVACLGVVLPQLVRSQSRVRNSKSPGSSFTADATTSSSCLQGDSLLVDIVSLFVVMQLVFFTLMAVTIMRLKLFWTPYLCLSLALLAQPCRWVALSSTSSSSPKQQQVKVTSFGHLFSPRLAHALMALLLAYMALHGQQAIKRELAISGTFMDLENEALASWLQSLSANDDRPTLTSGTKPLVVAGNLPLMGQLRLLLLAGNFAFTNHPHYEDAGLRHRTILADSVYSGKPIAEVWRIYRRVLDADFVVVNEFECHSDERGCTRAELFRLMEGQAATGRQQQRHPFCDSLFPAHTSTVSSYVTPPELVPFFRVVYVDAFRGLRVVLLVRS